MEEPENIAAYLERYFAEKDASTLKLKGKRILITAGPTHEKIDAVRFIGNYSTGKMGFALAETCARLGAEVELIAGPVSLQTEHTNIHRTDVVSADEMYQAATELYPHSDAAILCAAVADFTPEVMSEKKIKREGSGGLNLNLLPTRDIAAELGKMKTNSQRLVGFALETDNEQAHAADKLKRKNFDFIVLNSLKDPGAGFMCDTNKITIIHADGSQNSYPLKSKKLVSEDIIQELIQII